MGTQGKGYALVSMTNGDVYHIRIQVGLEIQKKLAGRIDDTPFIHTTDIKNGTEVSLNVNHISSIVVKEGFDRA